MSGVPTGGAGGHSSPGAYQGAAKMLVFKNNLSVNNLLFISLFYFSRLVGIISVYWFECGQETQKSKKIRLLSIVQFLHERKFSSIE